MAAGNPANAGNLATAESVVSYNIHRDTHAFRLRCTKEALIVSPRGNRKVTFDEEVLMSDGERVSIKKLSEEDARDNGERSPDVFLDYSSFCVPSGYLLCQTQLNFDHGLFMELSMAAARVKAEVLRRQVASEYIHDLIGEDSINETNLHHLPSGLRPGPWPQVTSKDAI